MASRYWRFLSRSNTTPTPVICELEMFSSANPTVNLCVGGTATASSEYSSDWLAEYAFDGIKTGNTGWSALDDPFAWLQYEFTSEVEVDEIAITSSSGSNATTHGPRIFFIQYRNEANEWVTRFAHETPQWATNQTRRFTANVTDQSEGVFPIVHIFNGGTPDYVHGGGSFIIPYAYTNFKGDGTISGKLAEKGQPIPGTVTLVHADTQQILKTKETNSLGEYEFTDLRRDFVYDVIAQDQNREWEKKVSSLRRPVAEVQFPMSISEGAAMEATEDWFFDPLWSSVSSLMRFDGNSNDETGLSWNQLTTPEYLPGRFGLSLVGNSTSAILEGPNDLIPAGAFTVEAFVWFPSPESKVTILSQARREGNGNQDFNIRPDKVEWRDLPRPTYSTEADVTIPIMEWVHVAFVYDGTTRRIFLEGELVAEEIKGGWRTNSYGVRILGEHNGFYGESGSTGRIDELRITQGVARYESNFTPPSLPFNGGP